MDTMEELTPQNYTVLSGTPICMLPPWWFMLFIGIGFPCWKFWLGCMPIPICCCGKFMPRGPRLGRCLPRSGLNWSWLSLSSIMRSVYED